MILPRPVAIRSPSASLGRALAIALLMGIGVVACGDSERTDVIDRETFIDTYVDLRIAALDTDSARIGAADREAILARHGVSEDDLVEFVEVYGSELEVMRDVWNEVEVRMDRTPEAADESRPADAPEPTRDPV